MAPFFVVLMALGILVNTSPAGASGSGFDRCVNRLHAYGGLSKDESRVHCMRVLNDDVLECQNKKFLVDFVEPRLALQRCEARLEMTRLSDYSAYTGAYEPVPSRSKKTVCSITVNSSDEREAFRRQLDPKQYAWVELLPQNAPGFEERFIPRDDLWIQKACREKVRCDIVVISGHFASTFLGSSGFEVKLEDLTRYSCDSNCSELFSSVRDVYLFGCNTLSEKQKDSRSLDQYRTILVEDGVSPHHAQRIVARRYTEYGQSIRHEVRQVFPQAEQIYGYAGPGPTGPNVKPVLQSYLKVAHSGESSPKVISENFKRTLGRTGMLSVKGVAKDGQTCQANPSVLSTARLKSVEGIREYAAKYSRDIPVAVFDVISEAYETRLIESDEVTGLVAQVLRASAQRSPTDRRKVLCPQILSTHPEWVPTELECRKNLSWMNNGREI